MRGLREKILQNVSGVILTCLLIFFFLSVTSCYGVGSNGNEASTDDLENYKYLKDRISKNPDNLGLYLDLAEVCMVLQKNKEAKKYLDHVIKECPREDFLFNGAHRRMGHLYLNTGKIDNAVEESKIIERIYPEYNGRWELNGQIYYTLERYDDAERHFMGEFVNATCTDSFVGLGNIYRVEGKDDRAGDVYRGGIVFDPEGPATKCSLANIFVEAGKYKKASKIFEDVIENNPKYARVYIYIGNMERKRGDYSRAIEYYNKALKQDKNRLAGEAYAGLGKAYLKTAEGRIKKTSMKTSLVRIIVIVGLILVLLVLFAAIKKLSGKMLGGKLLPSRVGGYLFSIVLILLFAFLLWFLFSCKGSPLLKTLNPERAIHFKAKKSLEKAIELNPQRRDLHIDLSFVLLKLGNTGKAKEEEKIASGLPEYNLKRRLRFISP